MILRGLVLKQPWGWACIHARKDVENRSRPFGLLEGHAPATPGNEAASGGNTGGTFPGSPSVALRDVSRHPVHNPVAQAPNPSTDRLQRQQWPLLGRGNGITWAMAHTSDYPHPGPDCKLLENASNSEAPKLSSLRRRFLGCTFRRTDQYCTT